MDKFEAAKKGAIVKALIEHKWHIVNACKDLGISRATLYRSLKRYSIERTK